MFNQTIETSNFNSEGWIWLLACFGDARKGQRTNVRVSQRQRRLKVMLEGCLAYSALHRRRDIDAMNVSGIVKAIICSVFRWTCTHRKQSEQTVNDGFSKHSVISGCMCFDVSMFRCSRIVTGNSNSLVQITEVVRSMSGHRGNSLQLPAKTLRAKTASAQNKCYSILILWCRLLCCKHLFSVVLRFSRWWIADLFISQICPAQFSRPL